MREKTNLAGFAALAILLAGIVMFGACPGTDNGNTVISEVVNVKILLENAEVIGVINACKGDTLNFSADVTVTNGASKDVTWTVSGGKPGTVINSETGVLNISLDEETGAQLIVTATSAVNQSKKAAVTVKVIADPFEVIHLIYSDGEFGANFSMLTDGWETNVITDSTAGGGFTGTKTLEVPKGWGEWGWGMGIDAASTATVDWSAVDALSFWVKASNDMVVTFGFLDDVGSGADIYNVEITGETVNSSWKRVLIPLPRSMSVSRKQVFKLWIPNTATGSLYIDEICLVTVQDKTSAFAIPESVQLAPNASEVIVQLIGTYNVVHTFSGGTISLASTSFKPENWFTTITYAITGNAGKDGAFILAGPSGNFELVMSADDIISNTMYGEIKTPSSRVIDNLSASLVSYTFVGANWYMGIDENTGGRRSLQHSGEGPARAISRATTNDITPFITANTCVVVGMDINGAPYTFNFELTVDGTPYSAEVTSLVSDVFIDHAIPLSSLKNGGTAITSLPSPIVISGWKVSSNQSGVYHLRLSGIELEDLTAKNITKGTVIGNGDISVPAFAYPERPVGISIMPESGYQLKSITTTPVLEVTGIGETRIFIMPGSDVTVNAEFEEFNIPPKANIALGRGDFAKSSRVSQYNGGAVPANAFDGVRFTGTGEVTHWQTQPEPRADNWIGVDLGDVYDLGYVIVVYGSNGSDNDIFTAGVIQVEETTGTEPSTFETANYSDDGWKTVGTIRNLSKNETPVNPAASMGYKNVIALDAGTKGRYIRVKMAEILTDPPAWTLWPRVSSFEVYKELPDDETVDTPIAFYNVILDDAKIVSSTSKAVYDQEVTVSPVSPYSFDTVTTDPVVALTVLPNGSRTFRMPASDITISATFGTATEVMIDYLDDAKTKGSWGWFGDFLNTTYGYWRVDGGNGGDNAILAPGQGEYNIVAAAPGFGGNTMLIQMTPTAAQTSFAIGKNLRSPLDISSMSMLRILFKVSSDNVYSIVLYNGGTSMYGYTGSAEHANNGTGYEVVFESPASGTDAEGAWTWVEVPLNLFDPDLDLTAITGWGLRLKEWKGAGSFWIDTIMADQTPAPPAPVRYNISVNSAIENGTLDVSSTAIGGNTVFITVRPDVGYGLKTGTLTVTGISGAVTVSGSGNSRTFIMPEEDVSITAVFDPLPIPSSAIIDAFDYYAVQVEAADLGKYGFNTSRDWWTGLIFNLNGRNACQTGGKAWIQRTNEGYFFADDITPFVTEKPKVSIWVFTRVEAAIASPNVFTFELHTGQHSAVDSQHVVWTAPPFDVARTIPNGVNLDSGWTNIKIPLENFKDDSGIPITSLSDIIITGWRIDSVNDNLNLWIGANIELVED